MESLINIFDEFFSPDSILFREEQINKIEKTFQTFNGNMLLLGGSGTGKTTTIKHLMKKHIGKYLYTSIPKKTSALKALKNLANIQHKNYDVIFNQFIENLVNSPKILIIDEINRIYNLSDFFDMLNSIYRRTNVPIIIISNKETILSDMPNDARLTLFLRRISFSSYNALELQKIVRQRLTLLGNKDFPEFALNLICAIASKDGSARNALYMSKQCLFNQIFTEEYIRGLEKELQREDWEMWKSSLTDIQKRFIKVFTELHESKIHNSLDEQIKSIEIQNALSDLSPQRVSKLITEFENYGIISATYLNLGRAGGRSRLLQFTNHDIFAKMEGLF